ncbi:hypothetical protein D3C81_1154780 [compost metagenome]
MVNKSASGDPQCTLQFWMIRYAHAFADERAETVIKLQHQALSFREKFRVLQRAVLYICTLVQRLQLFQRASHVAQMRAKHDCTDTNRS